MTMIEFKQPAVMRLCHIHLRLFQSRKPLRNEHSRPAFHMMPDQFRLYQSLLTCRSMLLL